MDEKILQALMRLRLSGCRFSDKALADSAEAVFTVYIDGLRDLPLDDVVEACRRWPAIPERGKWWPALEELRALADDIACEHRMRALPRMVPARRDAPMIADHVVIDDPALMRRTIADMRANPGRYVAAEQFAAIGEAMLARWADQQSTRRPQQERA